MRDRAGRSLWKIEGQNRLKENERGNEHEV